MVLAFSNFLAGALSRVHSSCDELALSSKSIILDTRPGRTEAEATAAEASTDTATCHRILQQSFGDELKRGRHRRAVRLLRAAGATGARVRSVLLMKDLVNYSFRVVPIAWVLVPTPASNLLHGVLIMLPVGTFVWTK